MNIMLLNNLITSIPAISFSAKQKGQNKRNTNAFKKNLRAQADAKKGSPSRPTQMPTGVVQTNGPSALNSWRDIFKSEADTAFQSTGLPIELKPKYTPTPANLFHYNKPTNSMRLPVGKPEALNNINNPEAQKLFLRQAAHHENEHVFDTLELTAAENGSNSIFTVGNYQHRLRHYIQNPMAFMDRVAARTKYTGLVGPRANQLFNMFRTALGSVLHDSTPAEQLTSSINSLDATHPFHYYKNIFLLTPASNFIDANRQHPKLREVPVTSKFNPATFDPYWEMFDDPKVVDGNLDPAYLLSSSEERANRAGLKFLDSVPEAIRNIATTDSFYGPWVNYEKERIQYVAAARNVLNRAHATYLNGTFPLGLVLPGTTAFNHAFSEYRKAIQNARLLNDSGLSIA